MTCCPSDSLALVGGVWVSGHKVECVKGEPRVYVWPVAGLLTTGTLADYARQLESRYYSGDQDEISPEIRTWTESYTPVVKRLDKSENDYIYYKVTVENESVTFSIDGRA